MGLLHCNQAQYQCGTTLTYMFIHFIQQLLLARLAGLTEESHLSASMAEGSSPPLALGGGVDITPLCLRGQLLSTVVLLLPGSGRNALKGASPPTFTPEVSVTRTSFCLHLSTH